ncbi:hypothetical protein [Aquaticitalea lipolytica]|nr:hypothetical protein [Aquaticitalea lipolytica]
MRSSFLIYGIVFLAFSCKMEAQPAAYGMTVFGTDLLTSEQVKFDYGAKLDELIELYESNRDNYEEKKNQLEKELNNKKQFSYVNVKLFVSYRGTKDFIIDIVEKKDANRRLNYREIITKKLNDPDGLLKKWEEYALLSKELYDKGEIADMSCPVVHCTWGFNHIQLNPFLEFFNRYAPKNIDYLKELLVYGDNETYRSNAAFLLVHTNIESQELVQILEPAIDDPSSLVRNNSMRLIYYAVRENNSLDIPIDKVIDVLDFPSFTDRNKALVVLRSLPSSRFSKSQLDRIIPILLEILDKKDAHNYKNAHTVLKNISSNDFEVDDIDSWKNWSFNFIQKN